MHRFSAEMNVREDAPHAFIWHTVEDQAVPVENSLMLAQAYRAKRVPFEMHIFPQGAHAWDSRRTFRARASGRSLCSIGLREKDFSGN